jgi:hypothetical protein
MTESVVPRVHPAIVHFEILEPEGLAFADYRAHLDDFAELVAMAQVVAKGESRWLGSGEAADQLRLRRASYGSPFMLDAQVIDGSKVLLIGLTAVGTLLRLYAGAFKTYQEGRRTGAEADSIQGDERREQIRFDREEAAAILTTAAKQMDAATGKIIRGAVEATDVPAKDGRKDAAKVNRFLRALWRLAQKESAVLEVEDWERK